MLLMEGYRRKYPKTFFNLTLQIYDNCSRLFSMVIGKLNFDMILESD